MQVVDWRCAQVLQRAGGGADDDDLAGELVRRTRALRFVEVLVEVAIRDLAERAFRPAPGEHDVVGVRHRVAEIERDARGEGGNLPAADHFAQQVAPADAVLVRGEWNEADAPVLARQDKRGYQPRARAQVRVAPLDDSEVIGKIRDAYAFRLLLQRQMDEREVSVLGPGNGLGESRVVVGPKAVLFDERDVENDGARLLRREALHKHRMHHAGPLPAAGLLFHVREAFLVDVDQDDFRIGLEDGCLTADEFIEEPILEGAQNGEEKKLQAKYRKHCQADDRQGAVHASILFASEHVAQGVEQLDAGVDLLAVDRHALDVDAERDRARVGLVEDAAQVVAADLYGLRERPGRTENGARGRGGDYHAEPAQERERLVAAAGREREHDAPRLDARAAAVAQVVDEQPLRPRRVIHRLRDEIAAALDAFGEEPCRFAALGGMALGDHHAAHRETARRSGGEADRARERQRIAYSRGRASDDGKKIDGKVISRF